MTTQDIIDYFDCKPYLDHRIQQLTESIKSFQDEKQRLEYLRTYVNRVTDLVDGIPIRISRENGRVDIHTVVVGDEGYRWGNWYKSIFQDNKSRNFGVCINGKTGLGGYYSNLYQGDRLIGFYPTSEEAERVLMDWIVRGVAPHNL